MIVVQNRNHLNNITRTLTKEKADYVVIYTSPFDKVSQYLVNESLKNVDSIEEITGINILLVDSFETPDLFANANFSIDKVPYGFFHVYDGRIEEYKEGSLRTVSAIESFLTV